MLARYRGTAGRGAAGLPGRLPVLGEELGLELGPALRRLEEQILDQDPKLDVRQDQPPAQPGSDPRPGAAPSAPPEPEGPPLVGRAAELDQFPRRSHRRLGRPSFVVSCEAGIGKTTLVRPRPALRSGQVVWGRSQE